MSTFCSTDNVPPSGDDISLWYWTFPKALIIIALGCWQYPSIVVNSTESADDNSTMYSLYPWVLLKPSVVWTCSRLLRRDLKQQDIAAKRMRCPQYLIRFSPSNFHARVILFSLDWSSFLPTKSPCLRSLIRAIRSDYTSERGSHFNLWNECQYHIDPYYNSLLSDNFKCVQKLPSSSVQVLHLGELG